MSGLILNQVLKFALRKLRCCMSPVARLTTPCFSDLTHIQKALIELVVSHLISREVHILAVGQYVVERLFL